MNLTSWDRIQNLQRGLPVDRVPWALWRHAPHQEFISPDFEEASIRFNRKFGFDLWKIGPRSSYQIRDHGVEDEFRGDWLGRPTYLKAPVREPSDWTRLRVLDPWEGWQGKVLQSAKVIAEAAPADVPVVMTIFSPLLQAKNLCGAAALPDHWRHAPRELRAGLEVLGESTRRLVRELRALGIHGIYYVIQECGHPGLSSPSYFEVCEELDRAVLTESRLPLNWLHLHGPIIDFAAFARYPAAVLHWDERASGVSLPEGARLFPGLVSGGISWPEPGTPDAVAQVRRARRDVIRRMEGKRFILSASCVVPPAASEAELRAAGEEEGDLEEVAAPGRLPAEVLSPWFR
jgi:uroporphyrinogen decarboxylase